MNNVKLLNTLQFVIYGNDVQRIRQIRVNEAGSLDIVLDVHGMTVHAARQLIMNIVNIMQNTPMDLGIIHGYNHGTAIKDMLAAENFNGRLSERSCPKRNPGLTNLRIAA